MDNKKNKIIFLTLSSALLTMSGCASMQQTENENTLGKELSALKQAVKEKDSRINKLQDLADDQQKQLRNLSDALNDCRKKMEYFEKQPNLK